MAEHRGHARRVLTFGEPLVVCVPDGPGKLHQVRRFHTSCAGAELNTAVGLARLDVPVAYLAKVGDDPFGEQIRRALREEGVDDGLLAASHRCPTGIYFKQWSGLDARTEVFYYRRQSAMAEEGFPTEPAEAWLASGEIAWVHGTGITWMIGEAARRASDALVEAATRAGATCSFDINVRLKLAPADAWRALLEHNAPRATWLFIGDSEAELLLGTARGQEVWAAIRDMGFVGEGVIVKRGAEGAEWLSDGGVLHVPAWPVSNVVDTVGAGDGFNAGFIAGRMKGWSVADALKLAALVGACAVTAEGDYEGYPTWREAMSYLEGQGGVER
ncbi:sugar kinase [Alicyclobacillus acidocaldarius]|uniref:PfkB domain protein n=1 Tax=Alicyclobacillus acidocaldarius subsp. acidocaldarius (strain ATCC 27009 / DSM 446 / BCRC 14685 / JCM 5260 / KCTC 1825 / NBRC 15652 / NCIMB 11725 / NRRL B-14509 / 104-IA) TaxID=521098 RepID=C8WRN9_ALIAD|nr:sugar kinase [Alicyclobacillus acidocaldarius]ACV59300.1 PfkB domain protein [Alicyclobacillus acidocaldarius subsp. acidocaldarius DSM 446]